MTDLGIIDDPGQNISVLKLALFIFIIYIVGFALRAFVIDSVGLLPSAVAAVVDAPSAIRFYLLSKNEVYFLVAKKDRLLSLGGQADYFSS